MTGTVKDHAGDRMFHEKADQACQIILSAASKLDRSSPAVLREIRDNLEIEIMIDRVGGSRRRLLRMLSEYCDARIREKERASRARPVGGFDRAPRTLVPDRYRHPPQRLG